MIAMCIDIVICHLRKRKTYDPVVGQLYGCPGTIIEVRSDTGIVCITGFGKDISDIVIEIAVRVCRMAKMKFPAIVEIEMLARCLSLAKKCRQQQEKGEGLTHSKYIIFEWQLSYNLSNFSKITRMYETVVILSYHFPDTLLIQTASAQKIVYSPPDTKDFNRNKLEVIGKRGNRLLVYKAVYFGNPYSGQTSEGPTLNYSNPSPLASSIRPGVDNAVEKSVLLFYDTSMHVLEEKELALPREITGVHFLVYDDFFYIFYQHLVKRMIYCMAAKVSMTGDLIGSPIEMDRTPTMDIHYESQIYSVINSEDKQQIVLFNLDVHAPHTTLLNCAWFDKDLHPLRKAAHSLNMDAAEYLSEFRVDNEGNLLFIGMTGNIRSNYPEQALLFILPRQTDSLSYGSIAPATINIDDPRLLVDNQKKRYILSSFYSRRPEGDIEGLFCLVRDASRQQPDKTSLTVLADSLRIGIRKGAIKTMFNEYYLQEMHLRKDGSFTIEAQQLRTNPERQNIDRWNYLPDINERIAADYEFFDAYELDHYYPWKNWHRQRNYVFSSQMGLIACMDSSGIALWTNVFRTPQLDRIGSTMGYKPVIANGLLYFVYNVHIRQRSFLTAQSVSPAGEVNTDSRLKEDLAIGEQSNDDTFFPRLGKQIDAGELIVPCRRGRYLCLAKINF